MWRRGWPSNHGVDVATAVSFRSVDHRPRGRRCCWWCSACRCGSRRATGARCRPSALLVGVQSLCLYSAVARLPVALALLAFNTYPLWTALWARVVYGHRPEPRVLRAMPVMLLGPGAGAGRARRRVGPGRGRAMGPHRRRRGLRAGGGGDLRPGAGADAARGRRPRRPRAHRHHDGHGRPDRAGRRGHAGRLSLAAGAAPAGGAWRR